MSSRPRYKTCSSSSWKERNVTPLTARLLCEEDGQDIIEYALLAALIGIVGILTWKNIAGGIGTAYTGWDTGVQDLSSCTPDPGGTGC